MKRGIARLLACRATWIHAVLAAQVQAMRKLNQPAVIVKAREVDVQIVQGVLDGARSKYKQTYSSDAPTVTMAENYLPGPPSGGPTVAQALRTLCVARSIPLSELSMQRVSVQCNL